MTDQQQNDKNAAKTRAAIAGADAVRAMSQLGPELLADLAASEVTALRAAAIQDETLQHTKKLLRNYEQAMDIYEKIHNEAEDIGNVKR